MSVYRSFAEQALHYFLRPHESVPDALLEHPAAWRGPDMAAHTERWLVELERHEIDALASAARSARRAGRALEELDAAAFPLPNARRRRASSGRKEARRRPRSKPRPIWRSRRSWPKPTATPRS